MAWIELHQTVWANKKTLLMAGVLGIPETYAAAHMARLWTWALDNAQDGDLSKLPPVVIAKAADWPGDPEQFVAAAVQAEYLDQDCDSLLIHDWYDYAGSLIEKRKSDAERKRKSRVTRGGHSADVPRTSGGHQADGAGNRTVPNHTTTDDDDNAHDENDQDQPGTPAGDEQPDAAKAECLELINRRRPDWVFSGERYREFLDYEDKLPWAVIRTAVDKTITKGAVDLNYCLRILETYVAKKVHTVADVEALDAEFEATKQRRSRASSTGRGGGSKSPSSNVILRRGKRDEEYYDGVFKTYDTG